MSTRASASAAPSGFAATSAAGIDQASSGRMPPASGRAAPRSMSSGALVDVSRSPHAAIRWNTLLTMLYTLPCLDYEQERRNGLYVPS